LAGKLKEEERNLLRYERVGRFNALSKSLMEFS
jgi:hypothetical protein